MGKHSFFTKHFVSTDHSDFRAVKSVTTSSIKDIYEESRNVHRAFQTPGDSRTEFTVLVQMPKNIENGPLLVKNVKRTFTAFVAPDEQGYQVRSILDNVALVYESTKYRKCLLCSLTDIGYISYTTLKQTENSIKIVFSYFVLKLRRIQQGEIGLHTLNVNSILPFRERQKFSPLHAPLRSNLRLNRLNIAQSVFTCVTKLYGI